MLSLCGNIAVSQSEMRFSESQAIFVSTETKATLIAPFDRRLVTLMTRDTTLKQRR